MISFASIPTRIHDDGTLTPNGPPADQPPVGYIPDDARVRLVAIRNPNAPPEHQAHWLKLLGSGTATPLVRPRGIAPEQYGTFVSGSYGVTRSLLVNPKFDRPIMPLLDAVKGPRS